MKKVLIAILVLVTVTILGSIQVTSVDSSMFPEIRINVISSDGAIRRVTDNGTHKPFTVTKLSESAAPVVDIAFVLDTTGSMGNEISGVLNGIRNFANELSNARINYRLGLITFGDEIRLEKDFTDSVEEFRGWVSTLRAYAGGDIPEISLDAIAASAGLSYRPHAQKIVIHITDAPYHFRGDGTPFSELVAQDVITLVNNKGLTLISVSTKDYEEIVEKTNGTHILLEEHESFLHILEDISKTITRQYEIKYTVTDLTPNIRHTVLIEAARARANTQYISPDKVKLTVNEIQAKGMGVSPWGLKNSSEGFVRARRAAIADAQSLLSGIIKGVQITSEETIEDGIVTDARLATAVRAVISGAEIIEETYNDTLGLYEVTMKIQMLGDNSLIEAVRNKEYYQDNKTISLSDAYRLDMYRNGLVTAVGFGVINNKDAVGQAIYKARRVAIADAQRQLAETLKGVRIDTNFRLIDSVNGTTIITKVLNDNLLRAEITDEQILSMPSNEGPGLIKIEMKVNITEDRYIHEVLMQEQNIVRNHTVSREYQVVETTRTTTARETYTGLIIEVAGLGLEPALFPRILTESGEVVYSIHSVDTNITTVIEYATTITQARNTTHIQTNPLTIHAKGVDRTDIIITNEQAEQIKQLLEIYNFFKKGAVVAVIGG